MERKKKKPEVGKSQKDGLQSTYSTNHKPCGAPREVLELQQEACAFEELPLWLGSSEVWGCPGLKVPIQRPARFLLPSWFCPREQGGRNAVKTSFLGTTVDVLCARRGRRSAAQYPGHFDWLQGERQTHSLAEVEPWFCGWREGESRRLWPMRVWSRYVESGHPCVALWLYFSAVLLTVPSLIGCPSVFPFTSVLLWASALGFPRNYIRRRGSTFYSWGWQKSLEM